MKESKRLIRNTGIIAIGNMSTKLVSFLLLPLYTSLLSTSEYGIQDYIATITMFCVPFITLLMDEGMFRFLIDCKTDGERKKVISISSVIILSGMVIFTIMAIPILVLLHYQFSVYFMLCVYSSMLSTMTSALFRGLGKIEQYAIYNFALSVAKIVLNVFFIAILKMGLYGMLTAGILSGFTITTIFAFSNKLWKYINLKEFDKAQAVRMIKYSIPLIPNKMSWSIINLSDRILVMNIIGSNAAGLFAISHKFPTLMDTVYGFFYQSWKESSARILQEDGAEEFYNTIYKYLKSFMYSIVVGMTAFMPLVFYVLINEKFEKALVYVPILLLATYFSNISGFYGGIFTAHMDTKIMGTTTVAAAIINIIINFSLIWKFGLYAAAISTLLANLVVYLYRKAKVRKYVNLCENYVHTVMAIAAIVIVWVTLYSKIIEFQFVGCGISILYAIYENKNILRVVLVKVKAKLKKN